MTFHRKHSVSFMIFFLVILGLAATAPPKDNLYKNLKILPKNITHDEMEKVMKQISKDLGVKCGFCHSRDENGKSDFASDKKEEKEIARDMMRMTVKLNKKYFHISKPSIGDSTSIVTCYTCHHGSAHIEKLK